LSIAVGLWIVALAISTLLAPGYHDPAVTFDSHIIRGVLLAWITFDLTRSVQRRQTMLRCFALGGVVVYLFGLAEAANVSPIRDWLVDIRGSSIFAGALPRLSSTLSYPNIAAIVIEVTLFPLLAWTIETRRRWLRFILGAGVLAGLISLILTYSRGGLIAFLISLIVVVAIAVYTRSDRRHWRLIIFGGGSVIAALVVATGLLMSSNRVVALRFTTQDDQSWYQVAYTVSVQVSARPGETVTIPVTLGNTGQLTWRADGDQPFHLSYHLLRVYPVRMGLQYLGQRTELPNDVPPGGSVTVDAQVITPTQDGDYLIQWDMVQEKVTWFSTKSAAMAETRLSISGEPEVDGAPFEAAPYDDIPPEPSPSRLTLWKIGLSIAQAHPLFGVGPDNYRLTYGPYLGSTRWSTSIHANNMYIEWLADTGIIGLLAFLLMSLALVRMAVRSVPAGLLTPLWPWHLALIASLCAWYAHGFVDFFYEFTPATTALWLLVGLAASTWQADQEIR
jgi:O-antigen ligase